MNIYKKITLLLFVVVITWQAKAQIPSGSKLWLRADTLVTISGGLVTDWGDCSGNGNNASQASVALQPTRILNYKNSKPAIYFDGTDIMNTGNIDFSATQQADIFIVFKDSQTVSPNIILELSDNYNSYTGGFMIVNNYVGYTHLAATYDGTNNNSIGVNSPTNSNVVILNDVLDRSLTTNENLILVNSVHPNFGYTFNQDVAGNFGVFPMYIGGRGLGTSFLTQGHYLEIIVYPTKLSGVQRNQVVNYLKNKYNISLDAPYSCKGGNADGSTHDSLINQTFPFSNEQYVFAGGTNDGSTHDSLINQTFPLASNQYVFAGGINDGSTHDSLIIENFLMSKNMFAFAGGIDDGSAHDSLINQNFSKSINMYAFGGGIGDGWAKRFTAYAGVTSSITCTGGTAVIDVTASGGIEPYIGTGTFTVTAGTYTYIVSDAAGAIDTLVVKAGPPNMIIPNIVSSKINCKGGISTVVVSAIGGTPPLSGLGTYYDTAGYHKYIITDANGCKDSIDITITEPATNVTVTATQDSIICPGSYTTVNVVASGGTSPYTGTGTFNAISSIYTYTVTDANGCVATTTLSVVGSGANLVIGLNPSPLHWHDTMILSSNIIGASYQWQNPLDTIISTSPTYVKNDVKHSIDSGVYKLSVVDSSTGCFLTDTIRIDVRGVYASAKAFLNGPYNAGSGLMSDAIRAAGNIPLSEPYSTGTGMQIPLNHVNGGGGETTNSTRLAVTGDSAVVDWVFLEFRDPNTPSIVKGTKSALLLRNGTIIDPSTNSTQILFRELIPGNYVMGIKHRNHFGLQSAISSYFNDSTSHIDWANGSISPFSAPVPFNTNPAYKLVGVVRTMWLGDVNKDRRIRYNGLQNDRLAILSSGFASNINGTFIGYRKDDVNMNGNAKYNGVANDRLPILSNLTNANATLNEQSSN